jgi:hypothetical protein
MHNNMHIRIAVTGKQFFSRKQCRLFRGFKIITLSPTDKRNFYKSNLLDGKYFI